MAGLIQLGAPPHRPGDHPLAAAGRAENLATNLRALGALGSVLDLLFDLDPVVFKGPLLTERVFGGLTARASADNDLWLPGACGELALGRLLGCGYRAEPGIEPRAYLRRHGQLALWPKGDLSGVSVDLHTAAFRADYFSVPDSVIQANLAELEFRGRSVLTFNPELTLCHLAAHWVQHHLDDAHLGLFRAAWLAFAPALDEARLRALVCATCRAHAFGLIERRAFTDAPPGGAPAFHVPLTKRARAVARFLPPPGSEARPRQVARKLLAVVAARPTSPLRSVLGAALLPKEELTTRYGPGSLPALLWRHATWVLRSR